MKALMIIDIGENTTCDNLIAEYKVRNTETEMTLMTGVEVLKPMPQFNKVEEIMTTPIDYNYFNLGWNSCLNTILGEDNEHTN